MYSLNPVTLPTDHLPARLFAGLRGEHARGNARDSQHALVLVREDLDELGSVASQFSRIHLACGLSVYSPWREIKR